MHDTADLTIAQKILVAAATLPEPFHESDLVVTAWKADPKGLGMKTREAEYPDVNRLRTYLVGDRGMVRRGWLNKVGVLTYTLSDQGRAEAARLGKDDPDRRRNLTAPKWPADLDAEVCRLLGASAFQKWTSNRPGQITRPDVRAFFDGDGAAARELVSLMLADSREYIAAGVPLACGRVVKAAELESLVACDEWLRKHFGGQRS